MRSSYRAVLGSFGNVVVAVKLHRNVDAAYSPQPSSNPAPVGIPAAADHYAIRRREAGFRWIASMCILSRLSEVCHLGCEDGYGSAILASAGLIVRAIGSDELATRNAVVRYGSGRITFRVDDIAQCHEPQHSADAVVCHGLLERTEDPRELLMEARRLLRPNGVLIVCTTNRLTASPGRTRPIDSSHKWQYTPDELRNLLRARFDVHRMAGLHHGRRLRLVERVLREPLAVTLHRVAPPDRAPWLRAALTHLRATDFVISADALRGSLDVIALATLRDA